jgi:hypothetical protein
MGGAVPWYWWGDQPQVLPVALHQVDLKVMTTKRMAVALEQVLVSAKESGMTPLQVVAGFEKGNSTQREIYKAIKAQYPEKTDG